MSTLYETCVLPPDTHCISVLEVLPDSPSPTLSPVSSDYPILRIIPAEELSIHPPPPPLQFRLKVLDLDKSSDFTALSYAWGLPTPTQPSIRYGTSNIPVTRNCYSALLHLRKALGGFTIWIDTICIYSDRPGIKNLKNLRSFIQHAEEPNRDSPSIESFFA